MPWPLQIDQPPLRAGTEPCPYITNHIAPPTGSFTNDPHITNHRLALANTDHMWIHFPQQCLYLRPEPHGQGSLRPTLLPPGATTRFAEGGLAAGEGC